ncbi:hypothetical protein VMCG_10431 [Cytospora schulzeri]|uniref:Uncharacterized protein n=1 Tax=Cytospora schulzeri TaxID=448051 RepID=A0A423VBE4_9PEZI|nr:hypothetical protein VMCG_10431 [Valsa malicola]
MTYAASASGPSDRFYSSTEYNSMEGVYWDEVLNGLRRLAPGLRVLGLHCDEGHLLIKMGAATESLRKTSLLSGSPTAMKLASDLELHTYGVLRDCIESRKYDWSLPKWYQRSEDSSGQGSWKRQLYGYFTR